MYAISAALVRHDASVNFFRAAKHLADRGGVALRVRPVTSLRALQASFDPADPPALVVTDWSGWTVSDRSRRTGEARALRTILSHPSAPDALVFVPSKDREVVSRLSELGVREVVLEGEEDAPGALALVLSRILLPPVVEIFLDGFPGAGLHPDCLLVLLWGVLHPSVEFDEAALARSAGRDYVRMEAEFARAGAPEPRLACAGAVLVRLAYECGQGGASTSGVLASAGIRDRAGLRRWCGDRLGEDPVKLLEEGNPSRVLECLGPATRPPPVTKGPDTDCLRYWGSKQTWRCSMTSTSPRC